MVAKFLPRHAAFRGMRMVGEPLLQKCDKGGVLVLFENHLMKELFSQQLLVAGRKSEDFRQAFDDHII